MGVSFWRLTMLFTNGNIPGGAFLHRSIFIWLMIQLVINVSPCISTYSRACRDVCECTTSGVISCTRSNLRKIPRFDYLGSTLGAAMSLYLDNNHISVVGNGTFQGLELVTYIDLNRNKIQFIARRAFEGLRDLMSLRMNNNLVSSLRFFLTKQLTLLSLIENEIEFFDWEDNMIKGAQALSLRSNKIESIKNNSFPVGLSITRLYLTHNKIQYLAHGAFNNLNNLEELTLMYNFIRHLPYLGYLPSLRTLILNNNNLLSVGSRAFSSSMEISMIIMSHNPKLNALGWIEKSSQEHLTKLDFLSYSHTLLDSTSLMRMDGSSLSSFHADACGLSIEANFPRLPNMDKLSLIGNKITTIFGEFLKRVPNVKSLYLYRNLISDLSFLRSRNEIEVLSLHSNDIHILHQEDLIWMSNLRILHLENNYIKLIPKLQGMNILSVLKLQNNKIAVIRKDAFDGSPLMILDLSYNSILEPSRFASIRYLDIRETQFDTTTFYETFGSVNAVKYLFANRNKVQHMKNLPGLKTLFSLEMSKNEISNISDDTFQDMKNLIVLKLHQNAITSLTPFQGLSKLKVLNLAGNKIKGIHQTFLTGSLSLRFLSLHDNQITDIDSFPNLPALTNLYLGRNQIKRIKPFALSIRSIEFLDLSNNLLSDISFVNNLLSLQHFLIYNNSIRYLNSQIFQNLTFLRSLNLAFNDIYSIDSIPVSRVTSFTLNISGNAIDQIDDILVLQSTDTSVYLVASKNNISAMNLTQSYSHNLVALFISDNPIRRIHGDQLPLCDRLTILLANSVELPYHEIQQFRNYRSLRWMQLNRNPQFVQNLYSGNATSVSQQFPFLEQLLLERNGLKSFPRLFLDNLAVLSLRFNEITHLSKDYFREYTPKINTLFLENNRIAFLNSFLFADTGLSLKYLYLNSNLIKDISLHAFSNLPNLLTLQLSNNNFTTLPKLFSSSPRKWRNIYLEGNPLVCDERLQWVKDTADIVCHNCTCSCPSAVGDHSTIVPLNDLMCPLVLTNVRSPCDQTHGSLQIKCPTHAIPAPVTRWNVRRIPDQLSVEVVNDSLNLEHHSHQRMGELEEYELFVACRSVSFDSELNVYMVVAFRVQPNFNRSDNHSWLGQDLEDTSDEPPQSSLFFDSDELSNLSISMNGTLNHSDSSLEDELQSTTWKYSYPVRYECFSTVVNFTLTSSNSPTATSNSVSVMSVVNRSQRNKPLKLFLFLLLFLVTYMWGENY